ncbi:MAG: leucine-rich repeat protein [Clostridia bacterium]|nr:leucine-rich repeat protein [Clostridia bacterium]
MKKRLFLTVVMVIALALTLALVVSAESVHAGKVDLSATVTLSGSYTDAEGNAITTVNLFDAEGNALIWYKNGSILESIRADDARVIYKCTYAFGVGNSTVGSVTAYEVSDMWIELDSGNIAKGNIVVLNLMDDDVLINNNRDIGQPVNCLKTIAGSNKVLEYAFCRLDTVAIQQEAFCGCTSLKYINLEDLTELRQIGGSQTFGQSSLLFKGETLDLTGTKLCAISGNGAFNGVPIVGLKLPSTVTSLNDWNIQGTAITSFVFPTGVTSIAGSQFNDCKSLTTIYINNTTTKIYARAFNNTALEKVFFVGTEAEAIALIDASDMTNNSPLVDVIGESNANLISYANYQKLQDKSGKYFVYDYSYCEAYNEGVHTQNPEDKKDCTGYTCTVCLVKLVTEFSSHNPVTKVVFAQGFTNEGAKITSCANWSECEVCNASEKVDPLFTASGYSLSPDKMAINGGYTINHEVLGTYESVNGTNLKYGIVIANAERFDGKSFFDQDNKVNTTKALQVEIDNEYSKFDCSINFGATSNSELKLIICAYVIDGDNVTFIQADSGEAVDSSLVTGGSFKSVTLDYVAALPTSKEEEMA